MTRVASRNPAAFPGDIRDSGTVPQQHPYHSPHLSIAVQLHTDALQMAVGICRVWKIPFQKCL